MPDGRSLRSSLVVLTLTLFGVLAVGCLEEVSLVDDFANGCDQQPVLTLLQPREGQTIQNQLPMVLELSHFNISRENYDGENNPCEGHLHIFLGQDYLGAQFDLDTQIDVSEFEPGEYVFRIEVHENDHTFIESITPVAVTVTKE